MLRLTDIKLPLDHAPEALKAAILKKLKLPAEALLDWHVFKRAHDARNKGAITYIYTVDVTLKDESRAPKDARPTPDMEYRPVARPSATFLRPLVVGAGPCGLFAALILAQAGFRPIILERGKAVRERTKDTWGLWRRSVLDPESNVQFGEGGAGTFSDGKLYSQIKDPRHLGRKVLTEFVKAGAPAEILTEAHPHIGTFRLVTMVESLRETIEGLGGEYRFRSKVADLLLDDARRLRGVRLEFGEEIAGDHVMLALGHSARDTFQMLFDRGVAIQAKSFSHWSSHRASAEHDRQGALRPLNPAAGRRRLQAGASRQGRPQCLQLLHVPRRHGRGGGQRARTGGDQWHEPVFAQ